MYEVSCYRLNLKPYFSSFKMNYTIVYYDLNHHLDCSVLDPLEEIIIIASHKHHKPDMNINHTVLNHLINISCIIINVNQSST